MRSSLPFRLWEAATERKPRETAAAGNALTKLYTFLQNS
ncbi:hypothetical protein DA2_1759 [Desulfovibrio sp. A2]|nr:hypothetical protein DA2_1759 [Desulfovibrio sp. A2]